MAEGVSHLKYYHNDILKDYCINGVFLADGVLNSGVMGIFREQYTK